MPAEPVTPRLFDTSPRTPTVVASGAIHVPDWLGIDEQRELVDACREWAKPPAPMQRTKLPGGGVMSVQTVCLGWHWLPYRYSRIAENVDRQPVKLFPDSLVELGRRAVTAASVVVSRDPSVAGGEIGRSAGTVASVADGYTPDAALVNFYDPAAKMGLHQDKDERSLAPVVSISLGDSCVFRFGNTEHRNRPYTDIELRSGDLFVFGGESRLAFHGVTKILPATGSSEIGLSEGRLNITLRVTGLPGSTAQRG